MKANCGMGVLPHSALEFIVRGLAPAASILSASSICLERGLLKDPSISILKVGAESWWWVELWRTIGHDLEPFLMFLACSSLHL